MFMFAAPWHFCQAQQDYALVVGLRAFFTGDDLTAVAVVAAAAARAARFGFAAAGAGVSALRPSPDAFARAERVAA